MENEENDNPDTLTVEPPADGTELLDFLSRRFVKVSKKDLRHLIAQGEIRLNDRVVRPKYTLHSGDLVTVPTHLDDSAPRPEEDAPLEIDVLYEDDQHIVLNKPPGYPVLPDRQGKQRQFYASVMAVLNRNRPPEGPYVRPHILHRLDRETSGVLLVAKNRKASRALSKQFESGDVHKTYLVIVEGRFPREEARIELPIARQESSVIKMEPNEKNGKASVTNLILRERFGHFSLLEARPETGRQHQIRVHLQSTGYPPLVDFLYGRREILTSEEFGRIIGQADVPGPEVMLDRCPLHAFAISYARPGTGEPMHQEAPVPEDMRSFLELLRQEDKPPAI